jgi:hypothetical protein
MRFLGCVMKSIGECILLGDNWVGRSLRYFSSAERLQRWKKEEEKLRKLKSAKYHADEIGQKQIGMAIEMERQARDTEKSH